MKKLVECSRAHFEEALTAYEKEELITMLGNVFDACDIYIDTGDTGFKTVYDSGFNAGRYKMASDVLAHIAFDAEDLEEIF